MVSCCAASTRSDTKLVCIGDIHGQWDAGDDHALTALEPDLALFVGDYGNEDCAVTGRISALAERSSFGVATVFGNHDAFYTAHSYGRSRAPSTGSRVPTQKMHLANTDVSYTSRAYSDWFSVVGGRAFSWGGPHWKHSGFYKQHVGITSVTDSTNKIIAAVCAADTAHALVFLAHVGPTGLGNLARDPCGRDWGEIPGGDWGDIDLRAGIDFARKAKRRVPLVVFGHMHRELLNNAGHRKPLVLEDDGAGNTTVFLNAAVVPRQRLWNGMGTVRNFHVVTMNAGGVQRVDEIWATTNGETVATNNLYVIKRAVSGVSSAFGDNVLVEAYRDDAAERAY